MVPEPLATLSATQVDEYYDSVVSYLRENVSYCFLTKNPLQKWKTSTWCKKVRPSYVATHGTNSDKERNPNYVRRKEHSRKRQLKSNNLVPRRARTRTVAARNYTAEEVSGTTSLDGSFSDVFGI